MSISHGFVPEEEKPRADQRPAKRRSGRARRTLALVRLVTTVGCLLAVVDPVFAAEPIPELPRSKVIASYYFGFSLGSGSLDDEASRRAKSGSGASFAFRLGMSFFEEIPINFAVGEMFLKDLQPLTEYVETCTSYGGTSLGCSTAAEESSINVGHLSLDTGYQRRFRVLKALALVPAALVGYAFNPGGITREVGCDGCVSVPIQGIDAAGFYVAPALRLVFPDEQFFAISARYEWFLSGSRENIALFGLEILAP
jgi:hypothetical protein